jgi:hypothetical protein
MKQMTDTELISAAATFMVRAVEMQAENQQRALVGESPAYREGELSSTSLFQEVDAEVLARQKMRQEAKVYHHKGNLRPYLLLSEAKIRLAIGEWRKAYIYRSLTKGDDELYVRTEEDFNERFEKGLHIEKTTEHQGKEF